MQLCGEHVNSLRWGRVMQFVFTSISVPLNCCTLISPWDGFHLSQLVLAASPGVEDIFMTRRKSQRDDVDSRHPLL